MIFNSIILFINIILIIIISYYTFDSLKYLKLYRYDELIHFLMYFFLSLLGFKMAVNEGLTVFNLVDGIVDEFHDESGTDEAEGSNDTYCATSDFYKNQGSP